MLLMQRIQIAGYVQTQRDGFLRKAFIGLHEKQSTNDADCLS